MRLTARWSRLKSAISDWPVWTLPRWLTAFVFAVVALELAAIGVAASFTTITGHDLSLFGLLLLCTLLAVELSRAAS
jgi:hypothetical protein